MQFTLKSVHAALAERGLQRVFLVGATLAGQVLTRRPLPFEYDIDLAFHGTQLLSGSTDGTVRLWDFDSLLAVDPGAPLPSVVEDTDGLAAAGLGAEELGV